ncbi:hypothetical protein ACFQY7_44850 [Actinomadura luteofluorescens]|uniref:hypothetical protein n=1 Tax=Actinomadura luteofluorescens TaxID=46163 RepID=UPI003640F635
MRRAGRPPPRRRGGGQVQRQAAEPWGPSGRDDVESGGGRPRPDVLADEPRRADQQDPAHDGREAGTRPSSSCGRSAGNSALARS